jgi:hypothetical protein
MVRDTDEIEMLLELSRLQRKAARETGLKLK